MRRAILLLIGIVLFSSPAFAGLLFNDSFEDNKLNIRKNLT